MTELSGRQWLNMLNRAVARSAEEQRARLTAKKPKRSLAKKVKKPAKPVRRPRAAAE
jgi:hypothetical protein